MIDDLITGYPCTEACVLDMTIMFNCNSTNITEYTCDLYINTFIA